MFGREKRGKRKEKREERREMPVGVGAHDDPKTCHNVTKRLPAGMSQATVEFASKHRGAPEERG